MFNLSMMVSQSARETPEKTALVFQDETWTYAELDRAISVLARGLLSEGLEPGDAVGVQLGNTPSFVLSYYGILRAGLVAVPFNPRAVQREIGHILSAGRCRAIIVSDATAPVVVSATESLEDLLLVVDADPEHTASAGGTEGVRLLRQILTAGDRQRSDEPLLSAGTADDDAVVVFTSGTTGSPKGAVLSHFNLWMSCTALASRSSPHADDVALACLPLFHVFGMSGVLNVAMAWGMTLVLADRADAQSVIALVDKHRVTRFSAVPTMLNDLIAAEAGGCDLSSVRRVTSGGAPLREDVVSQFEEMFPRAELLEGYGASETTSSICVNQSRERRKIGSVGTPSWGTKMRLTDEMGRILPPGAEGAGELQVTGPTIFSGYVGDPGATASAFDGGWFRTGDVARIDDDGYVYIVDRLKDMIIRAGYNVYPSEVEQVLQAHPQISEAVVVGVEDDRVGQEIGAVIVPKANAALTEDQVKRYAREQLSPYKCPRIVKITYTLPRSGTGKVLRRRLSAALS